MVQILFYRNKCIGCNACVEAAFSRWRISKRDGKSVLIDAKENRGIYLVRVNRGELQANRIAAANCPVNCIRVTEC